MTTITFPLRPRMKRPEVADLQDTLRLLLDRGVLLADDEAARRGLSAALQEERTNQVYGPVTGELVARFRQTRGLPAGQGVDEATANALNTLLAQWRVTDAPARHAPSMIPGLQPPDSGEPADPGTGRSYYVEGRVVSRTSPGVGGLRVVIVDKGVGGNLPLVDTGTDERGAYRVAIPDDAVRRRAKDQLDLQARVFTGETFLGASDVHYDASARETLDVLLDGSAASALPSEHEVLTRALAGRFAGRLCDLEETDDRQDITYLANKTGWDARAVALAALAERFSAQSANGNGAGAIPPAFFYALLRAGLPVNEDLLYHTDAGTLEAVWQQAAAQGVIARESVGQIPNLIGRFQALSARKLLDGPALAGASSLSEMLAVSGLNRRQQTRFARLYAANRADLPAFWNAVRDAFGADVTRRLQLDGRLGYLTINNAPLMRKLHRAAAPGGLSDPVQLAQMGCYRAERWEQLLTDDVPIPKEIPGDTAASRRASYSAYLAAQVRLPYPTAAVAQMIRSEELCLTGAAAGVADQVAAFLTEHRGSFNLAVQPVEQYIAENHLEVPEETVRQVKRVQRVYQITPNDGAMIGLLSRGIDAAYHVVRHDRDMFVRDFAADLGGEEPAALTYDRAVQVHNAVLNIVLGYLTARTAPAIGVHSPAGVLDPTPAHVDDVIPYATLERLFDSVDFCACDHCRSLLSPAAYLVDLLLFLYSDSGDWTVFLTDWHRRHDQAPYPFADHDQWHKFQNDWNAQHPDQPLPDTEVSPFDVLMSRRPDIRHLPLSCENTNTALPYIDLVNETLEYYIANGLSLERRVLDEYHGHDTSGVASEDLLASPQFVMSSVYTTLNAERFPAPLPFHRPLESLRRHYRKLAVPLPLAMERLRATDDLERGAHPYGWRDILMEELALSRAEHEILTDSDAVPLWRMAGFPDGTPDAVVIAGLSRAKQFARRVQISYEDLVAVLKTRFVNPHSDLIPKLARLGVPFATLKSLKDGAITDAAFDALLPGGALAPDPAEYGGRITAWVTDDANYGRIMGLITLTDTSADQDPFGFDTLELRHARPMANLADTSTRLDTAEFVRLLRFIRLWKKLGWTIEQTDAAICALFRADLEPAGARDIDTPAKLDGGFRTLIPRLGIVVRVMQALNFRPERDLLHLLACWSEIGTHGDTALYRQMFLNPALLRQDDVFADNGYGEFLRRADVPYTHPQNTLGPAIGEAAHWQIGYDPSTRRLSYAGVLDEATRDALKAVPGVTAEFQQAADGLYRAQRLATHAEALRAAFGLTADEYDQIVAALHYDAKTALTLSAISAVFRRGWLARKLKLSVRELLLVSQVTGLDPFAPPDLTDPAILRLIELIRSLKDRSLKLVAALYLVWNQDLSGKSAPDQAQVAALARTLRLSLAAVETEFTVQDDADGAIAQTQLARVYGADAAAFVFGLLNDTRTVAAEFADPDGTLAPGSAIRQAIEAAAGKTDAGLPKIRYDEFRKRLSYSGIFTDDRRDAVKQAAGQGAAAFKAAVGVLYDANQDLTGPFFARYPELRPACDAYVADTVSAAADKRTSFLTAILPDLARRMKRQKALQAVSTAVNTDPAFAQAMLDAPAAPFPLHAAGAVGKPGLDDLLAVETAGLSVQFFAGDTATAAAIGAPAIASTLDYAPPPGGTGNPLPASPAPGDPISGVWNGYLEAPENGFFKLRVTADPGATATLLLDHQNVDLTPDPSDPTLRQNSAPIELRAGTLHHIVLTVERVRAVARLEWEWDPKGQGRAVIPARYLYPDALYRRFDATYVRFLKAASLGTGLGLTAAELAYFATHADYRINAQGELSSNGHGWLNALPETDNLHLADQAAATIASKLNAALLTPLRALRDFARIKASLPPGDERLLGVLEDPAAATRNADSLLYTLTRWDGAALDALLVHFGKTEAGGTADREALRSMETFARIHDAFTLVRQMGIPARALTQATTNEPGDGTVRDLQAALRARYDPAGWRAVARPITDEMRGLQRDALVACILQRMRSHPETEHLDTPDKLFEYFLMDVQMEPCMETSRIRHALSSIQLFIERCLMNLEPRVSPEAITAGRWQWMKRYRVWEANRKIQFFPENWLDPELRDDKSPFCKEAESELFQSDITEERAAIALLNYLSRLQDVAKLEPCGIFHVADPKNPVGGIDHVIARTTGAQRKYYYRRHDGAWTAWEHVKLDIEDNPVVPVVWNDRLFLFWLRILKESPLEPPPPAGKPEAKQPTEKEPAITGLTASDFAQFMVNFVQATTEAFKVSVKAVLCWSEYYNGKWQPTRTSDVNQPASLGPYPATGAGVFDRSVLRLRVSEPQNHLRVDISGGQRDSWFVLYNTHSLPVLEDPGHMPPSGRTRTLDTSKDTFAIAYHSGHLYANLNGAAPVSNAPRPVLGHTLPQDRTVEPQHPLEDPWGAPFFYEDADHVFFVTTPVHPESVPDAGGPGVAVDPGIFWPGKIPPLEVPPGPPGPPELRGDARYIHPVPAFIDPAPMRRFVTEDAHIRRAIGATGPVTYGDRQIGPWGALARAEDGS